MTFYLIKLIHCFIESAMGVTTNAQDGNSDYAEAVDELESNRY